MIWVELVMSSAVVVYAAIKLAEYGDVISVRTKLGGLFIGVILMAGATSLPEFLTAVNAIKQGFPDLSGGDIFGSNMYNMLLLALVSLLAWRVRVLRKVARRHGLTGSSAALLITLATFFIFADIDLKIGWVGVDSLIIILTYAAAVKLLRDTSMQERPSFSEEPGEDMPGMPVALIGFGLASLALVMVMPWLVTISHDIAEMSGLGDGFVGVALVAFISSLPELIATIAAVRMGVFDLAVGNLFGSNMFNMFALGLVDFFYTEGRFLAAISRDFVIVGFLGLVMTLLALQGNQARMERKFLFMEVDAFMLILVFIFGMLLIASRGIGV